MDKLFTLLELQRQAAEAQTRAALLHVIVNETRRLIAYDQAVFWRPGTLGIELEKISGNAVLDSDGVYATTIKTVLKGEGAAFESGPAVILLSAEKHKTPGAILLFRTAEEGLLGGLWIESKNGYGEAETRILEELAVSYAQSLALWAVRGRGGFFARAGFAKKWKTAAMLGALVLFFFPVHLNITAPAEIVAKKAEIVAAPFDGMVESVHVEPGDTVKEGDLLLTMEHQTLQAQMDMAQQDMLVTQSSLSRLQRESLGAPDKKASLTEIQAEMEARRIAYEHAKELKDRSDIRAGREGIAVFSEANALRGKPVRTGDRIMMVADPADYELLVRVPADAMVPVESDATVRFFLNVSPLSGHDASVRSVGYQASVDPDGLLTYKIMALLDKPSRDIRIGWKGTATIEGGWTILGYAILRRPLIALRNMTRM